MALTQYHRKRRFGKTPEPKGKLASLDGSSFVVQKHRASHLHYDFRLEMDGVLKSWAVPKGPSINPSVKRLAMHVEDHPVAYGTFEGTIPQGEYGGGTVMLWDHGTWEPLDDPKAGYRKGRLKFQLHGDKLRGGWMLVRSGGRNAPPEERRWLLFKERDGEAGTGDILEIKPLSVKTGRDLDGIAENRKAVKAKATDKPKAKPAGKKLRGPPHKVAVQLATLVDEAPNGDDWLHEIKFDGYRMLCTVANGGALFTSRNQQDWTKRLPSLTADMVNLPVKQAVFDGEVVALRPDGTTDFQELQNAFRERRPDGLHYYIFDLLHLDGRDLRQSPLEERKAALARLLVGKGLPKSIRYSEHIEGKGPAFLKQACRQGLEGIICKRRDKPYRAGRGADWLKAKCVKKDEFVIGGYTDPAGSRTGFGALLVGYHDAEGNLVYGGKVGTGFDGKALEALGKKLGSLERKESPFFNLQRAGRGTHWVQPRLVGQFEFGSWTRDGLLRHASFQGLREDKPAAEITRDKAVPIARAVRKVKPAEKAASPAKDERQTEYDEGREEFAGVRLTSPDKVLYPEDGITKLELAAYYKEVEDWILPHIVDRPLALVRCPEGHTKECFFQKHPAVGTPDTLRRIPVKEKSGTGEYVVVDDLAGLISLAQIGALEIHSWGSRCDKLEQPDRLVFDLDPDTGLPWKRVVDSAVQVRDFLKELGLESFVKTTGGKGLHLVVPIERRHGWEETGDFCKQVAGMIVAADPEHYTANMSKAARPGKIFVDYLRNRRGSTAVAPYSTRARPGATVSVPMTWRELAATDKPDQYTIRNVAKRLASLKRDPWEGIAKARQSLAGPLKKLRTLG